MNSDPFPRSGPAPSETARGDALQAVSAPATALLVVSLISIGTLLLSLAFDAYLLLSGAAARLDPDGIDPQAKVAIRMAWGVAILAASFYVLWGSLQMKRLANYAHARMAAIVAAIPCIGPCCLLGIPFGIWALNVLVRPEVRSQFDC